MKPLVAYTLPDRGAAPQKWGVWAALKLAGCHPLLATPERPPRLPLDGLVLGGGTDLHPSNFGSTEVKERYRYDERRDAFELDLYRKAKNDKRPVFGICRGAQLMNVAEGGSLYPNIARSFERANYPSHFIARVFFRKPIQVSTPSLLFDGLQKERTVVNSMHTQSVARLGNGFRETSREPNGIIQSIEHQVHPFLLGVQFHPEFLLFRRDMRRLFRLFADACRTFSN